MNKLNCYFVDSFDLREKAEIKIVGDLVLPFDFELIKYQEQININVNIKQNKQTPLLPKINKLCFLFLHDVLDFNEFWNSLNEEDDNVNFFEGDLIDFWPKLNEIFPVEKIPKRSICLFYGTIKKIEDLGGGVFSLTIDNYFNILNQLRFNKSYFLVDILNKSYPDKLNNDILIDDLDKFLNNFNFINKTPIIINNEISWVFNEARMPMHSFSRVFPNSIPFLLNEKPEKIRVVIDNVFEWLKNVNEISNCTINFLPFGFFKFDNKIDIYKTKLYLDLWKSFEITKTKEEIENNNDDRAIGKIEAPEKIILQDLKTYDVDPSSSNFENYKRDGGFLFNDGDEFSFLPGTARAPNANNEFGKNGGFENGKAEDLLNFLNLNNNVNDLDIRLNLFFTQKKERVLTISELPADWKNLIPRTNLIDVNKKQNYNENSFGNTQFNLKGLIEYTNYESENQTTPRIKNELPFFDDYDVDDENAIREIWASQTVYSFEIDLSNLPDWQNLQPILVISQKKVGDGWKPITLEHKYKVNNSEQNTGDLLSPIIVNSTTTPPEHSQWKNLTNYEDAEKWFPLKNTESNFTFFTRGTFQNENFEIMYYGERIYYKVENNKIKFEIRPWITTQILYKNIGIRTFDTRLKNNDNLYSFRIYTLNTNNKLIQSLNNKNLISNVVKLKDWEIFVNDKKSLQFSLQLRECWNNVWLNLYQRQNNTSQKNIVINLSDTKSKIKLEFNNFVNSYQNHENFATHWFLGNYDFGIEGVAEKICQLQVFYLLDDGENVYNWLIQNKKETIKTPIILLDENNQRKLFTNKIKLLNNQNEIDQLKNDKTNYQIGFFDYGLYSNQLPTNQTFAKINTISIIEIGKGVFNWELINVNNSNYYETHDYSYAWKLINKYDKPIKIIERRVDLKTFCELFALFYYSETLFLADNFIVKKITFDNNELLKLETVNRIDADNDSLKPNDINNIIQKSNDEYDNLQNLPFIYFANSFDIEIQVVNYNEKTPFPKNYRFENDNQPSKKFRLMNSPNFLADLNFHNYWIFDWPFFNNIDCAELMQTSKNSKEVWDLHLKDEVVEFLDYNNKNLLEMINKNENLIDTKTNLFRVLDLWIKINNIKITFLTGMI